MVVADAALALRMQAAVDGGGAAGPRQEDLAHASNALQTAAAGMHTLRGLHAARDTELTIRLTCASVAIINSGSLAYRLHASLAARRGGGPPPAMPHLKAVQTVLEVLAVDIKHPRVLSRLRAAHFTPAKILDCLRSILWREMAGG